MKKLLVAMMAVMMMVGFVGCKMTADKAQKKSVELIGKTITAMDNAKDLAELEKITADFDAEMTKIGEDLKAAGDSLNEEQTKAIMDEMAKFQEAAAKNALRLAAGAADAEGEE